MAFIHSPKIITDGLILALDAANSKSYRSGSASWTDIVSTQTASLVNNYSFETGSAGAINITSSGYFSFITSSAFNTIQTNNSLTLSVWYKSNFINDFREVVGIYRASGNNPFVIRQGNNNVLFYDSTVGGVRTGTTIAVNPPTGSWIHACATFGNNEIRTYYNGQYQNITATSGSLKAFDSNVFGSSVGYFNFIGSMSNIQLYNRALSAQEVLQNYNATKGRFGL